MDNTASIVRLILAGSLVGLLAYCTAHVVQVWRKRNAKKGGAPSPVRPARKVAWIALLGGLVLVAAAGILQHLTRSEGVLSGEDLFVVRARDDLMVEWLHDGDDAPAGTPVARFGSGPSAARVDEVRARLARAEAETDVLALSPLTPDPELTRRHQRVAQERSQVQQDLGYALSAGEASERDIAAQLRAKTEALAKLEGALTDGRKDLDRSLIRLAHTRDLARTYATLLNRGAISANEYQEHQKALRDAEAEAAALAQGLKAKQAEKALLQAHLAKLEAGQADPEAPLRAQRADLRARLGRLEAEEAGLKAALDRDAARAGKLRAAELAQAAAKVRECQAGLAALTGGQEARAPFAGRVAYRAASPNAVRPGGALLVLGPDNGALLTARLARSEADAFRAGGEVVLEVEDGGPERHIPARFRAAQVLAHEPGHAAVQLECQPPPEVVRRLAEGEKLTVGFAWRPPLLGMWPFQAGASLALAGLLGLALTRPRPAAPPEGRAPWEWSVLKSEPGTNGFPAPHTEPVLKQPSEPVLPGPSTNGRWHGPEGTHASAVSLPAEDDDLEELYRDLVEDLNKAECPDEATQLLDQLHHVRKSLSAINRCPPLPRPAMSNGKKQTTELALA